MVTLEKRRASELPPILTCLWIVMFEKRWATKLPTLRDWEEQTVYVGWAATLPTDLCAGHAADS